MFWNSDMLNAEPQPEQKKMTDLELSMGRTHPNDFINLFLVTKRVVLGTTLIFLGGT
jgi:hypothetical protein